MVRFQTCWSRFHLAVLVSTTSSTTSPVSNHSDCIPIIRHRFAGIWLWNQFSLSRTFQRDFNTINVCLVSGCFQIKTMGNYIMEVELNNSRIITPRTTKPISEGHRHREWTDESFVPLSINKSQCDAIDDCVCCTIIPCSFGLLLKSHMWCNVKSQLIMRLWKKIRGGSSPVSAW